MINIFKNLLLVLNQNQKKKLYSLQGLIFLSTIIEIFSVAIIAPFMAIVGNVGIIYSNGIIKSLYISSGASSAQHFLILSGIFVLIILFTSACLSIITIRQLSIFAADIGAEFGNRLYQYYIKKNYIFHASGNSAELLKKISTEISRITDNILQPFVQINARVGTVLLVIIFVFIYNPYVAIVIFTLLVSVYYIIYRVVKWRLAENGLKISEYSEKRLKLMVEGFSSIKELHLLKKTDFYINKFEESGKVFAKSYGSSNSIYNSPRYIVEFIVYGVMIGLVVTLLSAYNGDVSKVLPVMSVFGVAAIKMLPSFQQIYSGVAQIKGNISALDSAKQDLVDAKISQKSLNTICSGEKLSGDIVARDLRFSFDKTNDVLKSLTIKIPEKKIIGIVGASGSGKSTLLDILIGAIHPDIGTVFVGEVDIYKNMQRWRRSIGYVSQMAALRDSTVAENIAFGCNIEDVDLKKLKIALEKSKLSDWVDKLPNGYLTRIGERGLQISGGQRQRIAIARAIYYDADYLFFDEATSALDGITEKEILESILSAAANKTVVMIAHRINTLRNCDLIYVISDGCVEDCGTYTELISKNTRFSKMSGNTN